MGESTGPPVLNFHKVWFVFGAVDFELPVCAMSWWNMGQSSTETSEARADSVAVDKIVLEKAETRNSTTRTELMVAFLFILFSPLA
jgi:hypothetical protein